MDGGNPKEFKVMKKMIFVTTGMADEGEHTRIPIVSIQVVADRYVEYNREDLTTSRKAAEWVERNIIRHSNRKCLETPINTGFQGIYLNC